MERVAGRYQLLKPLARGGMGEVHLARQVGLDGFEKLVVIKRILPDFAESPDFVRLFLDEARVAADLRHPNVVSVLEVGTDRGSLFLAMDYVHGVTMRRVQRKAVELRRAIPRGAALGIVVDIARALHYAHRKTDLRGQPMGIIHRDVSPQNVIVGFDGTARLVDFGIARAANRRMLTEPGMVVGKIDYMSPEQSAGGDLDARSDQFALGILLWELTVGDQLYRGSDKEVRFAVRAAKVPRPSERVSGYPVDLEEIVLRALAREPADRFADCGELARALESFAGKLAIAISAERTAAFLRELFPAEADERFVLDGVDLEKALPVGPHTVREAGSGSGGEHTDGNVPAESGPLVGREADLDALAQLVAGSRLVTLLGPGGAGKTRLSLAFAHRHRRKTDEPVWFCDLSEARTREGVLGAVCAGLVIPAADDVAAISKALAARGAGLVVLDNAEQIIAIVASALVEWMRASPAMRFLVTSRESLRIPGEAVYELGPLSLPEEGGDGKPDDADAVRLFLERARAVRRAPFAASELADIARLVRALDGLPLAIELAAARMHVLAPKQLLERFERSLDVLASGRRDVSARQATLRGAIEWSWNLLDDTERAALSQVSVFRGGFDLDAAEAVLDLPSSSMPVMDVIQSLREKSLLRALPAGPSGELRFGLYESIRDFAAERLDASGARVATERRHLEHYVGATREISQRLEGRVDPEARGRLAVEVENLVIAHRRALAEPRAKDAALLAVRACLCLEPIMSTRGPYRFFVKLVDEALAAAAPGELDEETLLRARLARGLVLRVASDGVRAREDLTAARELARRRQDRKLEARALRGLAYVTWDEGRAEESRAVYEEALAASREAGDESLTGRLLLDLAGFDHEGGVLEAAKAKYQEALAALRRCGDRRFEGVALGFLGALLQELGAGREALEAYDAAIAIHREVEDRRYEGFFVGYRATWHHESRNAAAARVGYRRAISLLDGVGDPRSAALYRGFLAVLDAEEGRLSEARERLDAAREALTESTLSPMLEAFLGLIDALEAAEVTDPAIAGSKRESARRRIEAAAAHRTESFDMRIVLRLAAR